MAGMKRNRNKAEREEGGIGKKKGEAERGEKEGNGGARETRKPNAENERKRDVGQKGWTANREEGGERSERECGDEIRRMAAQCAFARRGAERRRVWRLSRNAQREECRGKRGEGPCEALDDGDGIRNGTGAQREREEGGEQGGGKTPPPGFAGSPLKEETDAPRRGIARQAPQLGELTSEASLKGSTKEDPAEEPGGCRRKARRDGGHDRRMRGAGCGRGSRGRHKKTQPCGEARKVAARTRREGRSLAAPRAGRKLARRPPAGRTADGNKEGLRGVAHARNLAEGPLRGKRGGRMAERTYRPTKVSKRSTARAEE